MAPRRTWSSSGAVGCLASASQDCFDPAGNWVEGQRSLPAHQVEELEALRAEVKAEFRAP